MLRRIVGSMAGRQGPPSLRRLISLPTLVSLVLAALVLTLLVTRFNIDLGSAWGQIRAGNVLLYLLALGVNIAALFLRGNRWRLIAGNAGIGREAGTRLPGRLETAVIVQAGWFLNAVGWLRMGDGYRAYAFGRSARVHFGLSLGVIAAERVMDVVAILPLFLLAVAGTAAEGVRGSVVFIVVSAAMVAVALAFILALVAVGRRFARMLPPRLREQYIRFHEGALGSFRRLPAVGFYSFAIWLCEALRLFLVVHALGLSVSPSLVLLVSLVNAVLTTIPLTPGGIGFVEPGVVGALTLALSRDDAVAVALLDRSISYGSVLVFGALALAFYELVVVRRRAKIEGARASPSAP